MSLGQACSTATQPFDIELIANLRNLQTLFLEGPIVNDEQISELKKAMPNVDISGP